MRNVSPVLWIGTTALILAAVLWQLAPYWATPWIVAVTLYVVFLSYYQNWRGALSQAEIDAFFDTKAATLFTTDKASDEARAFFEADKGKEFFMQNLVRLSADKVKNPNTGEMQRSQDALQDYTRPFFRTMLASAGHPLVIVLRKGGDLDSWGPTSETGARWPTGNLMRYRSRRDLMNIISSDMFMKSHAFKHAAIEESLAYPTHMLMGTYAGPRIYIALILALGAALANIALLATA